MWKPCVAWCARGYIWRKVAPRTLWYELMLFLRNWRLRVKIRATYDCNLFLSLETWCWPLCINVLQYPARNDRFHLAVLWLFRIYISVWNGFQSKTFIELIFWGGSYLLFPLAGCSRFHLCRLSFECILGWNFQRHEAAIKSIS